jgi:hypothetical protein
VPAKENPQAQARLSHSACHRRRARTRPLARNADDVHELPLAEDDWDIDPDDADHPTIHGLRGTGILARAEEGYEIDQIANDIGMSRQNVEHYMRFRDQMKVGADGQKRLRLVNKED